MVQLWKINHNKGRSIFWGIFKYDEVVKEARKKLAHVENGWEILSEDPKSRHGQPRCPQNLIFTNPNDKEDGKKVSNKGKENRLIQHLLRNTEITDVTNFRKQKQSKLSRSFVRCFERRSGSFHPEINSESRNYSRNGRGCGYNKYRQIN